MTDRGNQNNELEAINEEHQRLQKSLKALAGAKDAEAASVQLGPLVQLLTAHFAREEAQGGFYEIIRNRSPQYAHALESLGHEHVELRERAGELARELEGGDFDANRAKIKDLVRRIQRHESRENQLLSDSVLLDLGSGD